MLTGRTYLIVGDFEISGVAVSRGMWQDVVMRKTDKPKPRPSKLALKLAKEYKRREKTQHASREDFNEIAARIRRATENK